jgi:hypothetical protein
MKKLIILLFAINSLNAQPIAQPDTIYYKDGERANFSLLANDDNAYKIIEYSANCIRYTARWSVRSVPYFGKMLLRTDGDGWFESNKNTPDTPTLVYTISDWKCGTTTAKVTFIKQVDTIVIPPDTTPTLPETLTQYNWGRTIGNSSVYETGDRLIRALRTPTGIVEVGNSIYLTTGLVEGNSGLMRIDNQVRTEIDKPLNGDITLNTTHICEYGGILYVAGFDSYGKISSAVIGYENGQQITFQYGASFKCLWQDNAYKSGIHVNKEKVTRLEVDASTIYVYAGTTLYKYDRLTGQAKGTSTTSLPTYIAKHNGLVMTSSQVTYNGKVICTTPTSPTINDYNFIPKDFNTYEVKGSVYAGSKLYVADAGNCRVQVYDLNGLFIYSISYLPMNYNASVDRNSPKRVFAKELEFEFDYTTKKSKLVRNWGYGLGNEYLQAGDNQVWEFLRDVNTSTNGTFAFIDYHEDGSRKPTLVKLTDNGLEIVRQYDWFANVHICSNGDIAELIKENGKANFYLNDTLKESVSITPQSALNGSAKIGYSNGSFVVYEPSKDHNGYHLSFVKGGVIKNVMPTKNITDRVYPYGDWFAIDANVEYAGGTRVYVLDNRIIVNYVGEFFGGGGGQTNLWFIYKDGVFELRVGKTKWETEGQEAAIEEAGNSYGGGVVEVGGKMYIITNCEHTSALQWFEIY